MTDEINIQYKFTVEQEGYPAFTDAIYLPLDEYNAMSDEELEGRKQERFNNFKAMLDSPPEPVDESAQESVTSVEQARQILADALSRLDALPADGG